MSNIVADQQLAELALSRLALIRAPRGYGVYASGGYKYHFAIYGRDSLEVGEDLLLADPALVREIIMAIARLQGRKLKVRTEEEPGKIHHEFRALRLGEVPVGIIARLLLRHWGSRWGGEHQELHYYGSVDSTPLFIRLVGRYVAAHGAGILDETVADWYGVDESLRGHVGRAIDWLAQRIEDSPWGLLEFQRFNPRGLPYQAWKDSPTGYLHSDGTPANADGGVASAEVQGYAYDALLVAGELYADDQVRAEHYQALAKNIQTQTLQRLWMADTDRPYFAIGYDRDEQGNGRQIQTYASNAAALLDSRLLYDLPEEERRRYVEPIVRMIMSSEFLTDVGVRTRALRHADLLDYPDYHGSLVSWPKETYDIAKGLRRHGYVREATQLEERLLAAVNTSGEFYEFYHIDRAGKVEYAYGSYRREIQSGGHINVPEPSQAWTISAILSIIYERGHL